jgi:hypothetical protein
MKRKYVGGVILLILIGIYFIYQNNKNASFIERFLSTEQESQWTLIKDGFQENDIDDEFNHSLFRSFSKSKEDTSLIYLLKREDNTLWMKSITFPKNSPDKVISFINRYTAIEDRTQLDSLIYYLKIKQFENQLYLNCKYKEAQLSIGY